MGIIPLYDWGEANALFFIVKFNIINKYRLRIKIFKTSEESYNISSSIYAILIS